MVGGAVIERRSLRLQQLRRRERLRDELVDAGVHGIRNRAIERAHNRADLVRAPRSTTRAPCCAAGARVARSLAPIALTVLSGLFGAVWTRFAALRNRGWAPPDEKIGRSPHPNSGNDRSRHSLGLNPRSATPRAAPGSCAVLQAEVCSVTPSSAIRARQPCSLCEHDVS